MEEAINTLEPSKSPGITQLHAKHLQYLITGTMSPEFLRLFTSFVNLIFNYVLTLEFNTMIASSVLLPFDKQHGVRPIAITETISKVIGRIVMSLGKPWKRNPFPFNVV